jgi:hypothetical protein
VSGFCGLNETWDGYHQELDVLPILGVRHQDVARVCAELAGRDFHPYAGVTIRGPLEKLLSPRFENWKFVAGEDHAPGAAELAAVVGDVGLPWMHEHATLEAVLSEMRRGNVGGFNDYQLLPVALALSGHRAEALEEMDKRVRAYDGESHPYAEELRAFAAAFRSRFDDSH